MSMSYALMLVALLPLPLLLASMLGYTRRAWWWAAVAAVVLFNVAAIGPPPEAGHPRVAGDDVVFLLVCTAIITGFAALGGWQRRLAARCAASRSKRPSKSAAARR